MAEPVAGELWTRKEKLNDGFNNDEDALIEKVGPTYVKFKNPMGGGLIVKTRFIELYEPKPDEPPLEGNNATEPSPEEGPA